MAKQRIVIKIEDKLLHKFLRAIGPEEVMRILENKFLESVAFDFGVRDSKAVPKFISNNKEAVKMWIKEEVAT